MGHLAPAQSSTHEPLTQCVPELHPLGQDGLAHDPVLLSHAIGGAHVRPPHCPQAGTHAPSAQTWPDGHDTPAQRLTQAFPRHDWPAGHTTFVQGVPH